MPPLRRRPLYTLWRALWARLWRHLQWRLFVAYLVIIVVTVSVQTITADYVAARSIRLYVATHRHSSLAHPDALVSQAILAFTISLFLATAASVLASAAASLFVAHRIVEPLERMIETSRRIAEGRYQDRIEISDDYEISHLAASLNSMAATLERTEQQRRELMGNVAHELRTPLTTIKGYMEALSDGVIPADAAAFALVREEAERLSRLVRDLQDLSRLEESGTTLHQVPVLLADLVQSAVEKMRPLCDELGVRLTVLLAPHLPTLQLDYDRMQQVLLNLLDNAAHYTGRGGTIQVEAIDEGGTASISITDTGVGIAPEHLSHIFTRFYRVDKSRSRAAGGSGIGLTIARGLVEAHEGTLTAESTPGIGTRFTIRLPIAAF